MSVERTLSSIPSGSILGINYSGAHDSAIALVSPDGEPLFACSLERVTREKQDGRPPKELLEFIPWERISCVAVSTDEKLEEPVNSISAVHPVPFSAPRTDKLIHGPAFAAFFDTLPAPKRFICHQDSHAASAFWLSGFDKALCFTYDGGMHNCAWFGGLYDANRETRAINPLDRFAATHYAKITSLYTAVTAILGFTPNKHEGKITGLAAFGKPTSRCRDILGDLFSNGYLELEETMEWLFLYSSENVPFLMVHEERRRRLAEKLSGISKEELAATVQTMAEEHVVQILKNAAGQGWKHGSICLAGGLFSNVKINQRVREFGFENIFIAPPMTDDGTALGAALSVAVERSGSTPPPLTDMGLGFGFDTANIEERLKARGVKYSKVDDPEEALAQKLSEGKVVAVFQGKMEFGPRALGRRSILCQATDHRINAILNERLRRTEFMPFAPMTRAEDANDLYINLGGAELAAGFMTITFDCSELMKRQSPAVVHVDGTARPQIVRRETEPFIHRLLTLYKGKTGIASVVNTSFNIHEEPIVCTPDDAIDGFLSSGVDYLYLEGGYLADFSINALAAISHITGRMKDERKKEKTLKLMNAELSRRLEDRAEQLEEKEAFILSQEDLIQSQDIWLKEKDDLIQTQESSLKEKDDMILSQESSLKEKDDLIQSQELSLKEKDDMIQSQELSLKEKDDMIQTQELSLKEKEDFIQSQERRCQKMTVPLLSGMLLNVRTFKFHMWHTITPDAPGGPTVKERMELKANHPRAVAVIEWIASVYSYLSQPSRLLKNSRNVIAREPLATVAISNRLIVGCRDCFASLAMTASLARFFSPKLGVLFQYSPRNMAIPGRYLSATPPEKPLTVSIVTPSYNHADFIERTMKSVLDQGYPWLEYIVQDGGSKDGTAGILERYADRLARWESVKDKGQGDAINRGFVHTTGEIMAYLNSDDVLLPGTINYVTSFFARRPDVDVVYGHRVIINENDMETGRWVMPPHDDAVLEWADYLPQETMFWRRRIWDKAGGGMDLSFQFALDWDLIMRFRSAGGKFVRLPRFLAAFRVHMRQKTLTDMGSTGMEEMGRIRERCHGRSVSGVEINEHVSPYLKRHVIFQKLYEMGLLRY